MFPRLRHDSPFISTVRRWSSRACGLAAVVGAILLGASGGPLVAATILMKDTGVITRGTGPVLKVATTDSAAYIVGQTLNYDIPSAGFGDGNNDGYITKVDVSGGFVWTRLLSDLIRDVPSPNSNPGANSIGYRIFDATAVESSIYVCGQTSTGNGFVVRINESGYAEKVASIFRASGAEGTVNVRSIGVAVLTGGARAVVVSGDSDSQTVYADDVAVPTGTSPNWDVRFPTFRGGSEYTAKRDAFLVRFDSDLAPQWGLAMGFAQSDDYSYAVTADADGNSYLGITFGNVNFNTSSASDDNLDKAFNGRKVYGRNDQNGTYISAPVGNNDFEDGLYGFVFKFSSSGQSVSSSYYRTCYPGENDGAESRIYDLVYSNGYIYLLNQFKGRNDHHNVNSWSNSYDLSVMRLDPGLGTVSGLAWLYSDQDENAAQISVDSSTGDIYLTGNTKNQLSYAYGSSRITSTVGSSSQRRPFWLKLPGDLSAAPTWSKAPNEPIPDNLNLSAVGVLSSADLVLLVGNYGIGTLTMGPSSSQKSLTITTGDTRGFVAFTRQDGTFLEEVTLKINSAYGTPQPHAGSASVVKDRQVHIEVQPVIYEDADGAQLDPLNIDLIRTDAVVRRTCVGYNVVNSQVSGSTNYFDFQITSDTEITFNWVTEYAFEVLSDLSTTNGGLTSTAAGNPDPIVKKQWVVANEQVTAFIDGSVPDPVASGVRYRSTGYTATGPLADVAQAADGQLIPWAAYQARQQTPKFQMSAPVTLVWTWNQETLLRISTSNLAAEGSSTVTVDYPVEWSIFTSAADGVSGAPGVGGSSSGTGWPTAESPANVLDGDLTTKYLNFGKAGSSVSITPVATGYIPRALRITAAADEPQRDPTSFKLEGSNDGENWTVIVNDGAIPAFTSRGQTHQIEFANELAFAHYRFTALTLADSPLTATAMQFAELALLVRNGGPVTNTGSGEYWFATGTTVTISSASSVSNGNSVLSLNGYTNGAGSVPAFSGSASALTFALNKPSTLTWDYSRAIYPQTVELGGAVTFSSSTITDATDLSNIDSTHEPRGISVVDAPPGSGSGNIAQWDPVARKLYPLRPGKFQAEFANLSAPDDDTVNILVEVTAEWPEASAYQHVARTPGVALDPSATDSRAFVKIAYTEGDATVDDGSQSFVATEAGRSVLVFSARSGGVAKGDLTRETLLIKTVSTYAWDDPAVFVADQPAIIGSAIDGAMYHDASAVGHNGYVYFPRARFNINLHARSTQVGPIIPVNLQFTGEDDDRLVVAWFRVQDDLIWPYKTVEYLPAWPANPDRLVVASRLGSEGLRDSSGTAQPLFTAPTYSDVAIYRQSDPSAAGYNPNEEHAITAPSFLVSSRSAAFALRNDLNVTSTDGTYTSDPYVLVQYVDRTMPNAPVAGMRVYQVELSDETTTDDRLPATNQTYTFFYGAEAGARLTAPYPLATVITEPLAETTGEDVDDLRRAYYEDKSGQPWVISGDTDPEADIRALFYYPRRADFWHPTAALNAPLSFGPAPGTIPNIEFNTVWPDATPVLKVGETITYAGGEAAADATRVTVDGADPVPGLPGVVAWQAGQVVFDEFNPSLAEATLATNHAVRLVSALESREVALPLTDLPTALQPAAGNVITDGLLWRFKDLDASLQSRVYYDTVGHKLGVRGLLNGRLQNDPGLTAAPGSQVVLMPNVLTPDDEAEVAALDNSSTWLAAVAALGSLSRNPAAVPGLDAGASGLIGDSATEVHPAIGTGPGLAVITNPRLLDGTFQTEQRAGYVTLVENDDPALGDAPVALHVIRVDRDQLYRGSLATVYPGNVFDEKITVRHTGDFGGNTGDLYYEWLYREDDGRKLNPPGVTLPTAGTPISGEWTPYAAGPGLNEVELAGDGAALVRDNLFYMRWRHQDADPEVASSWSDYAGAANSAPPIATSAAATTDIAYLGALVPGWIKRVTDVVNQFDARTAEFRYEGAPASYASMIRQAGSRFEGAVAFNPSKDVLESYGLIELYQTLLDRATALTIDQSIESSAVSTALLNAASRLAQFYVLLGNEAYTDAQDPTIGFATTSGTYGNLSPSIRAFQNQTGNLLEEEEALLRGRAERGAKPAYNRLLWNFTNNTGEAAYVMNYQITDQDLNGFIEVADARTLYPQGHGDAWGHYLTALKGYRTLLTHAHFDWEARAESYAIEGNVFSVDYFDERTFAAAAAAKVQTGSEIVDLAYREKYTDNPSGQWQGYTDLDPDRAWGVFEWAQRVATGAYFDWVTANALLPASDTTHTGVEQVDRTTVADLGRIAILAAGVQDKIEQADNGLNPLGLDPEHIPFDIDPTRTDLTSPHPATHFEQIYERALTAVQNATAIFDHATVAQNLLRETTASVEQLHSDAYDQDLALRNRLIEMLGRPYEGTVGTGKTYPAGYVGPDYYLHMYVDTVGLVGNVIEPTQTFEKFYTNLRLINSQPFTDPYGQQYTAAQSDPRAATYTAFFENDFPDFTTLTGAFDSPADFGIEMPYTTKDYAFQAPKTWGKRPAVGLLQSALNELLLAEIEARDAAADYNAYVYFELTGYVQRLDALANRNTQVSEQTAALNAFVHDYNEAIEDWQIGIGIANVITTAIDSNWDLLSSGDITKLFFSGVFRTVAKTIGSAYTELAEYQILDDQNAITDETNQVDALIQNYEWDYEIRQLLIDFLTVLKGEPDYRVNLLAATEKLRAASDKYRTLLSETAQLYDERAAFNTGVAGTTTLHRYQDLTFRIARNEALEKYRAAFDLAARYTYLAGKAYDFETNLAGSHPANARPLLAATVRARSLGVLNQGVPVNANGGLAAILATLKTNYDALKPQYGFNNPQAETTRFSLRTGKYRISSSSRSKSSWRNALATQVVSNLWDDPDFRQLARPPAAESAGPLPGIVIEFATDITAGNNVFGLPLTGGDSAYNPTAASTKIRSVGVWFDGYNGTGLSQTPLVYLLPVGNDILLAPNAVAPTPRVWAVRERTLPVPLAVAPANLADKAWLPGLDSLGEPFDQLRRFASFRAYHDSGVFDASETISATRLVGRSVWNTRWKLIIPGTSLLNDGAEGLNTFIYGQPIPGSSATFPNDRDGNGVGDIRLFFMTYSHNGQ